MSAEAGSQSGNQVLTPGPGASKAAQGPGRVDQLCPQASRATGTYLCDREPEDLVFTGRRCPGQIIGPSGWCIFSKRRATDDDSKLLISWVLVTCQMLGWTSPMEQPPGWPPCLHSQASSTRPPQWLKNISQTVPHCWPPTPCKGLPLCLKQSPGHVRWGQKLLPFFFYPLAMDSFPLIPFYYSRTSSK